MLVFVYGSLKRGFQNHFIMGDSIFKEKVKTEKKYLMFIDSFGGWPFLLDYDNDGYQINGELFEVTEERLKILDDFEGCPDYYNRKEIDIISSEGIQKAFCYFYVKDYIPVGQNPINEFIIKN